MNIIKSIQEEFELNIGQMDYTTINLYLELDRLCNMNCSFCRNQSLESVEYDLDAIIKNLLPIVPYLKELSIGEENQFFI